MSTKVITKKVRLSYVHLFEAWTGDDDKPARYRCCVMVPKSDKKTLKALREAQQEALEAGKDKPFGGKVPKQWTDTIRDGDERDDLDEKPEFAGHWFLNVSSNRRPGIVDRDMSVLTEDDDEIYSGVYARVSLNCVAYSNSGNKGVTFFLNNVQKLADGERLGGMSASAESDFESVDDDDE